MTGATLNGGTYTEAASYDDDLRLTSRSYSAGSTLLYQTQPGYDAVGNVTSVATTLPAGTDSQAFCYDAQNRLTWASSQSASGPCGASHPLAIYSTGASGTTIIDSFYGPDGRAVAVLNGSTLSYLGQDVLNSTTVALSTSGTLTASKLFTPYGAARYTHGSLPTTYQFAGQRVGASLLDDDGARLYDAKAGQFTSTDTVSDGLNRYA